MGRVPDDIRAQVLVDAAVARSDQAASRKHGVSDRAIRRWRAELKTNERLAAMVRAKMELAEEAWLSDVPDALKEAVGFIRKAAELGDPKHPDAVHAVAGAMKLLSEVALSWKVIGARLARQA